jgi:hypothetical protein
MAKAKEGKLYPFVETPDAGRTIRLLDGRDRRIRITLKTIKQFDAFPLLEARGDQLRLATDHVAALIWDVLVDKDDLAAPDDLLALMTPSMIPEVIWTIQEAATAEGESLKNGMGRIQRAAPAAEPTGSDSIPSGASGYDSLRTNSGAIRRANSPA